MSIQIYKKSSSTANLEDLKDANVLNRLIRQMMSKGVKGFGKRDLEYATRAVKAENREYRNKARHSDTIEEMKRVFDAELTLEELRVICKCRTFHII